MDTQDRGGQVEDSIPPMSPARTDNLQGYRHQHRSKDLGRATLGWSLVTEGQCWVLSLAAPDAQQTNVYRGVSTGPSPCEPRGVGGRGSAS